MIAAPSCPATRAGETSPPPFDGSVSVTVRHECDVAGVIGATLRFCQARELGALFGAHVATAASELANNLWMHSSRGGLIRLSLVTQGTRRGLELLAEDDGPGIADIALALTEGFSTGGGMGCGLPGVQRLMDEFSIESGAGSGTRVRAIKWLQPRH